MAIILDGRKVREEYAARLKNRLSGRALCLAIIQIGDKAESSAYIQQKIKFGREIGALVEHIKMAGSVSEAEVIDRLSELNADENVTGIIIQLPISEHLARQKIIDAISPEKDMDGLTSVNAKKRKNGEKTFLPATARGVMELMDFYNIGVARKKVAVLGRSIIAGGPIAEALRMAGAEVTVCHSQTSRAEEIKTTRQSDIVVVAIGKPKFLTEEFFTPGANQTVIDVGINALTAVDSVANLTVTKLMEEAPKKKLVGDVDFEKVAPIVGAISPVPGGVGQMTVLALFENLVDGVK